MVTKVVVCDSNYGPRAGDISAFVEQPLDWTVVPASERTRLLEEIRDADIIITSKFDAEMGSQAQTLRLLQCCASGTDGIDRSAVPANTIVCNTYHHEQSIAEHVIMTMLALSRDLLGADRDLRQDHWRSVAYDKNFQPHRLLAGKTVGIVGYGHIGQSIALLAKAFSMRVIALRRDPSRPSLHVDEVKASSELAWLMKSSDFVVVAAPLTEETRGSIGQTELTELGPDGFLINVGRGPIVDETALYAALSQGAIRGAAVDVWYQYPAGMGVSQRPSRYDFAGLPNVIMTPHHSGQASENFDQRIKDFAFNVSAMINGTEVRNKVR